MKETEARAKIKTLNELSQIISKNKSAGKTVVLCHGVFDLLHPGHIRHFEAARKQGDILVVTITPDRYVGKGPGHPFFNEQLRAESIASLESVDYVAINEWSTAVETIKKLRPNIYSKGSDYSDPKADLTGKIVEEEEAIKSVGGNIHFTDEITFSSSRLLNTYFDVVPEQTREFLNKFREIHSSSEIVDGMKKLKTMKVLVIGEAIIDEYCYCAPLGKSPKENLIAARYIREESYTGGILAIANHIAGYCDRVDMITCLGTDNSREAFIVERLKPNINAKFFYRPHTSTIVKRRYIEYDFLRKLFEVYFMDGSPLPANLNREICNYLEPIISGYDLVLIADYGHGLLGKELIGIICNGSKFLSVDTQLNSANIGFNLITNYPKADYFCINEPELRLATHDNITLINTLVEEVAQKLRCAHAAVTQGNRGSTIYDNKTGIVSIPVFSREVVDRVGAGDAFLAITSPCVAAGFPPDMVGFIGNAAGALATRIVGNKSFVEPVDLYKYMTTLLK